MKKQVDGRVPQAVDRTNRGWSGFAAGLLCAVMLICTQPARAQCNGPGPDIIVGQVYDVGNYQPSGGYDALALGAALCNVGGLPVGYQGCPANTHPLIGGQVYRYQTVNGAGRFEQVGISWLKHTAVIANSSICCSCQGGGGGNLAAGCSDVYNQAFNGGQPSLGPRYPINAYTGGYPAACPTHPSGGNFGRIEILLSDLVATSGGASATTRYFGEEQVIAPDDATWTDATHTVPLNGLNNASHTELTVSGSSSNFTFALLGGAAATQVRIPAIRRWQQIDSSVTESAVTVPNEGQFTICSKATALGGTPPMWHYEFAVFNLNSERCGGSFSVPVADGALVTSIDFHGIVYRGGDGIGGVNFDGTPWIAVRAANAVTWSTQAFEVSQNANALRFGTTYNFRFDSDAPPGPSAGQVTLGLWKPGTPTAILADAQTPALCSAPTILTNPASAVVCAESAAQFSVSASGSPPLSYRWQLEVGPDQWMTLGNDPAPLPCDGNSSFAYAQPPMAETTSIRIHGCTGLFHVRALALNDCGSATSASAALRIVALADMNCDCAVNNFDIDPFVLALTNPQAYADAFPNCLLSHADVNRDGLLNNFDIDPFVACLISGGCD